MAKPRTGQTEIDPKADPPVIDLYAQDAEILTSDPMPDAVADETPPLGPVPPAPTRRRSGFVGPMLGGIVAAGLGAGALWYFTPKTDAALTEQAQTIATQSAQIDSLTANIAALTADLETLKSAPDPTAALTLVDDTLAGRIDALQQEQGLAITALETRLGAVERAPNADGSLPQTAIDALTGDIETLRAQVADQTAQMQALAADAATQLEQARSSAAEIEQTVETTARTATVKVALAQVQAALASGAPYDLDLPALEAALGTTLSPALTQSAQTGVPTLTALQTAFPAAARDALATARSEGVSGEDDSTVTGFLRTLFDVRSVEPRTGTSTDAILSRAESALAEGRLADTNAEIASLPEVARTAFADWSALAQTRLDALAAVEAISLTLSEN